MDSLVELTMIQKKISEIKKVKKIHLYLKKYLVLSWPKALDQAYGNGVV